MRRNPIDAKVSWFGKHSRTPRASVIAKPKKPIDPAKAEVVWVDSVESRPTYVDGTWKAATLIGRTLRRAWKVIYSLRGIFLGLPVLGAALQLAVKNMEELPETVRFSAANVDEAKNLIFENFAVSREMAVYAPLALTVFCLVMMLISRRMVYPWVISIFTLILPIALHLVNTFP